MSSGERVRLSGIRERAQYLHRKISALNAAQFMKDAGVEIQFRSTELGSPEYKENGARTADSGELERDGGGLWFNVHAHLIITQKRFLDTEKEWKPLLKRVGQFWGHWWKDGSEDKDGKHMSGRIRDHREVCKYITKPGEMLKLTGPELVALNEQLTRLKIMQPMGELAAQMKTRKNPACPLRLVRKSTPDGGSVLKEVKNWNRQNRRTAAEKLKSQMEKLGKKHTGKADVFQIVSRSMPTFGPAGITECSVTVLASRWNETTVRRHGLVDRLIRATWEEFAAGKAIRVHTCTPTVVEPAPAKPWSRQAEALTRFRRSEKAAIFSQIT
jgi:hypothetical protein